MLAVGLALTLGLRLLDAVIDAVTLPLFDGDSDGVVLALMLVLAVPVGDCG
jgi:hypothetical protein